MSRLSLASSTKLSWTSVLKTPTANSVIVQPEILKHKTGWHCCMVLLLDLRFNILKKNTAKKHARKSLTNTLDAARIVK